MSRDGDTFSNEGWDRRVMDLEHAVRRLSPDGEQRLREERRRDLEARQRDFDKILSAEEAFARQKAKAEGLEKELDALRRRLVKLEGNMAEQDSYWAEMKAIRAKEEMKMATINETTKTETGLAKVKATTKSDLKAVTPRLGARQVARLARDMVITKGMVDRLPADPETRKAIVRFLKTKRGEAVVGGLLGLLLTYVELPGVPRGERTERITEELRREALTEFGDEVLEPFTAIVREVLTSMLGGISDDSTTTIIETTPTKED